MLARLWTAAIIIGVATATGGLAGPSETAIAHTPHDPVSHIELSPTFADDGIGFAVIDGRLVRTEDSFASSTLVVNGLTGGQLASVAIAPANAQVVYAAGLGGEIYRSTNGGLAFERLVVDPNALFGLVEVAADDPSVVVAVGAFGLIYRTTDGGVTWSQVSDLGAVTALDSARSGPSRFVAGNADGQIFVSTDAGASWQAASGTLGSSISAIGIANDNALDVVATTVSGEVHRSSDGANTFDARTAAGVAGANIRSVTLAAAFGVRTIWATTDDGALRSSDDGESFTVLSAGLSADVEARGQIALAFGTIAATVDFEGRPFVVVAGFDGVFQLDPDTDSWITIETFADAITGIAVSPTFGTDRTLVVTTYTKGAYLSSDGGSTFTPMNRGLSQDIGRSNTALPVRSLQSAVFSPEFATDRDIFSATDDKFAVSTDAGSNWKEVLVAPPPEEGPKVRHFAIGVGTTVIGPTIIVGSSQGVVYRSDRGGGQGTWKATTDTGSRVRNIVLSPAFSTIPELFLSTGRGVLYSDNGATTFSTVNTTARSALLAISPDFQSDRTVFAGAETGLEVSRDGGQTWSPVAVTAGPSAIKAVAISPNFAIDQTMLVSVAGSGLFRSVDSGATFSPIASDVTTANLIVADFGRFQTAVPMQFADDGTVVAFSGPNVLTSTDVGDTWTVRALPSYLDFVPPSPPREPGPEPDVTDATTVSSTAVEAPGSPGQPITSLQVEDSGDRDRRIWLVTALVCVAALGVMLVTARSRR